MLCVWECACWSVVFKVNLLPWGGVRLSPQHNSSGPHYRCTHLVSAQRIEVRGILSLPLSPLSLPNKHKQLMRNLSEALSWHRSTAFVILFSSHNVLNLHIASPDRSFSLVSHTGTSSIWFRHYQSPFNWQSVHVALITGLLQISRKKKKSCCRIKLTSGQMKNSLT